MVFVSIKVPFKQNSIYLEFSIFTVKDSQPKWLELL